MPISLRAASGGGAGTPIGGYAEFNEWLPYDLDINGARYLRSGYIETDTSKFDNSIFSETVGTFFTKSRNLPAAASEDDYVVASADNGTNTIVAVRGVNGQNTQLYVSTTSGVTWQTITWSIGPVRVNDVIWVSSLGLFVAVANAGLIGTSPNGTTWTTRYDVSGDGDITGVVFGAGRLVAVSTGNKVITSTNGTSWAYATTVPTTTGMIDVAFGGGKFIIAALSNQCLTSTDGNTWSIQNLNLGSDLPLTGISYGNSTWLVHTTSNLTPPTFLYTTGIFRSSDGTVWSQVKSNLKNIPKLGAKSRFRFYNGFWFLHSLNITYRSLDLTYFHSNFLFESLSPDLGKGLVCYHLNKWFAFRQLYSSGAVQFTQIAEGNTGMYAGNPYPMYASPVISSGGVVSTNVIYWYYVRIS